MGTFYNVTYDSPQGDNDIKTKIDSLLALINAEVSTYISTSTISQWNSMLSDTFHLPKEATHFRNNFIKSQELYLLTEEFFDPTVMPLVNYYGFGHVSKEGVEEIDQKIIDSLMNHIGLDGIKAISDDNQKNIFIKNGRQLDFSAIAKGYAVDQIANLLDKDSSVNYLVEIGGEVITKGVNAAQKKWTIGINRPQYEASLQDLIDTVQLSGEAMASSGNYRNYHEINGVKYGHTISPKTGKPVINRLLGVSVIAPDCMSADALATAFMVMGYEKAQKLVQTIDAVEACFFVGGKDSTIQIFKSNGFVQFNPK